MTRNAPHDDNPPVLYEQHGDPVLHNRLYRTTADARSCSTGDVVLAQNMTTGLLTNIAFQPDLVTYDGHYNNEQGESDSFRAHLEIVAEIIQRTLGREHLGEAGCGKGYSLNFLPARNAIQRNSIRPMTEAARRYAAACSVVDYIMLQTASRSVARRCRESLVHTPATSDARIRPLRRLVTVSHFISLPAA